MDAASFHKLVIERLVDSLLRAGLFDGNLQDDALTFTGEASTLCQVKILVSLRHLRSFLRSEGWSGLRVRHVISACKSVGVDSETMADRLIIALATGQGPFLPRDDGVIKCGIVIPADKSELFSSKQLSKQPSDDGGPSSKGGPLTPHSVIDIERARICLEVTSHCPQDPPIELSDAHLESIAISVAKTLSHIHEKTFPLLSYMKFLPKIPGERRHPIKASISEVEALLLAGRHISQTQGLRDRSMSVEIFGPHDAWMRFTLKADESSGEDVKKYLLDRKIRCVLGEQLEGPQSGKGVDIVCVQIQAKDVKDEMTNFTAARLNESPEGKPPGMKHVLSKKIRKLRV